MSHITIPLLTDLSEQQQEIITGATDFELAGSNFANRIVMLCGLTSSGPNGSFASSCGQSSEVNTAAQDFLGLGALSIPKVPALGQAPILGGLPSLPRLGLRSSGKLDQSR